VEKIMKRPGAPASPPIFALPNISLDVRLGPLLFWRHLHQKTTETKTMTFRKWSKNPAFQINVSSLQHENLKAFETELSSISLKFRLADEKQKEKQK
jgi:hypothetical protein